MYPFSYFPETFWIKRNTRWIIPFSRKSWKDSWTKHRKLAIILAFHAFEEFFDIHFLSRSNGIISQKRRANFGLMRGFTLILKTELGFVKTELGFMKVEFGFIKVEFGFMEVEFGFVKTKFGIMKTKFRFLKTKFGFLQTELGLLKTEFGGLKWGLKAFLSLSRRRNYSFI